MNNFFIPTDKEEELIQIIQKYYRQEFALVRLTQTMLIKYTIDANFLIRKIFLDNDIIDYNNLEQGKVYSKDAILLLNEPHYIKTSFYRPKSKNGDPRFWPNKFKPVVQEGDLIYITTFQNKVLFIPLEDSPNFEKRVVDFFGAQDFDNKIITELIDKIGFIKDKGWIKSVSPDILHPKDVGDTLEIALGLQINNIAKADFKGEIEIKAKRSSSKTKDTLFSMVPNWKISDIPSAADMMLTYGYKSIKHPGYIDLYVTVNNVPNQQGLFLKADDKKLILDQLYTENGINFIETCKWEYDAMKSKLYKKHPKTVWVIAHNKVIDGKIHFKYDTVQLTQKPIFSQFLSLIGQGIITFDWRGKVLPNKKGYRDHGHCFRLTPSKRSLLFGYSKSIEF